MTVYRHRQVGAIPIVILLLGVGAAAFGLGTMAQGTVRLVVGAVLVFLVAALVLFTSLVVDLDEERLWLGFGPGLVHRSFPLGSIRDAREVRNHWYHGWGIRLIPHGWVWLWNVSGLDAVELELRNGRRFRIGTDQPGELASAIRRMLPHNR